MKKLLFLSLLLFSIGIAKAQPNPQVFRRGTALPTICNVGDAFYKTAATAGQYNCTATNTWTIVTSGGGGGTCPSGSANAIQKTNGTNCAASTVTDDGTTVTATKGKVTVQDATAVTGVTHILTQAGAAQAAAADDAHALHSYKDINGNTTTAIAGDGSLGVYGASGGPRKIVGYTNFLRESSDSCLFWGSTVDVDASSADTGICRNTAGIVEVNNGTPGTLGDAILRHQTVNGTQNYCASATGSDTYTCNLAGPALTGYTAGDCIIFYPSVTSNTGAASLAINSLAAINIKTSAGNDPATGAIAAGSTYQLCYDGTNFLMPQDNSTSGQGLNVISISGSNAINGKFFFQKITITGNATISAINNIKQGLYVWIICQDGTGGWTFTWPASVKGGMTIGSTLSTCNTQEFASDGTSLYATTPGVINE